MGETTSIRHRRGTAANWASTNPVLAAGVLGLESDTTRFKFGDGANRWSDLPYVGDGTTDPTDSNRVVGFKEHAPTTLNSVQVTSTTATYIGGGASGIRDFSVDFKAPASGQVRITANAYVMMDTSVNEYVGMALAIGGQVIEESKRLVMRRGALSGNTPENRVNYEYVLINLVPGANYTVTLCAYVNSTGSFRILSGGSFGGTTITAEQVPVIFPTWSAAGTVVKPIQTVVSDAKYNSFPGLIKCPNGDLLGMYRQGTSHFVGSAGLRSVRSTDNGYNWGASAPAVSIAGKDMGTATLSSLNSTTIALVTWTRATTGNPPDVNATRIYLSTNSGVSWGSPYQVNMPSGFLGKYSLSESALTLYNGYYYLAVWGEPAGSAAGTYQAGIIRSTDLITWELVNDFGATGWNESGVTVINGQLVAFSRKETGMVLSTTTSSDGVIWTPLKVARTDGVAAPKFATTGPGGYAFNPLRIGPAGGYGYLAAANSAGEVIRVAHLGLDLMFMYGQAVEISPFEVGVLWAAQSSTTDCRIYFASYLY